MAAPGPIADAAVPPAKAWILVDAASGLVLDAGNARQAMPPASLTKLLTAVVAAQTLALTDSVPVSARAAGEPAHRIGMKAGEAWPFRDALYALLLSSANDAAAAIAERIGGSLENFAAIMSVAGQHLGLADQPVLQDPAGLDDNFSVAGGNLLSARDIAVLARAALAQPEVATAVATDTYSFTGPDGVHHHLTNHIHTFLTTYPGAIGLKPGFTAKAGYGVALAARRNGRTMIAVVLDAANPVASATALLDRGFAIPPDAPGTGDVLPAVRLPDGPAAQAAAQAAARAASQAASQAPARAGTIPASSGPATGASAHKAHQGTSRLGTVAIVLLLALPVAVAVTARRREVRRRRKHRVATRQAIAEGRVTRMRQRGAAGSHPDSRRRTAQR